MQSFKKYFGNGSGKKIFFLLFLLIFSILYFSPNQGYKIYDITNNNILANDFSIKTDFWDIIFCPFSQIPDYFLHFEEYRLQLISWFAWFFAIGIILFIFIKIRRKRDLKQDLSSSNFVIENSSPMFFLKIFLTFWLLIIFVIFFPYPGNKIQPSNPDEIIVDFHSHTYYSWDAMSSFKRSIDFHKKNGYDAYFTTEHDLVLADKTNVDFLKNSDIFVGFGEEVPDFDGVYHLIFNIKTAITRAELSGSNYESTISNLNKNQGIAAAALWWQNTSIHGILQKKFACAEISNMGHRNYRGINIEEAIRKFKEQKIQMIGTTDWHGWGYKSYIWTAIKIPNWKNMNYIEKENTLLDALRGKYQTRVLEYKMLGQKTTLMRYIFEPFFGIFYMLSSQSFLCLAIWFFWIFIFVKAIKFVYTKNKVHFFWFLVSYINFAMALKFYIQWQDIKMYNKTLNNLAIYFLVVSILALIVGMKKKNFN